MPIKGEDLQWLFKGSAHPWRTLRHPWNRQTNDFRFFCQELFDYVNGHMPLDDVPFDLGRVAGFKRCRNPQLLLLE